jgi:hypothetical protein
MRLLSAGQHTVGQSHNMNVSDQKCGEFRIFGTGTNKDCMHVEIKWTLNSEMFYSIRSEIFCLHTFCLKTLYCNIQLCFFLCFL